MVPTSVEKVVIVVGETVTGTDVTVSMAAGEGTPLKLAVMVLVPTPTPVARPLALIVATEAGNDPHVTLFVMICVETSL